MSVQTDRASRQGPLVLGIDVGSTTVKAVVVDSVSHAILWSDYQRHQTKQAEKVLELLGAIAEAFPEVRSGDPADNFGVPVRSFITGSGSSPLVEPLGSKFVQ